jgi:hypothetical protein
MNYVVVWKVLKMVVCNGQPFNALSDPSHLYLMVLLVRMVPYLAIAVDNMASHLADICSLPANMYYDRQVDEFCNAFVNAPIRNSERCNDLDDEFTYAQVEAVFRASNTRAAMGFIGGHFLRHHTHWFVKLFIAHHVMPVDWRSADVAILHKPDTATHVIDNYRPISLTSVVVKCLEHLILNRIIGKLGHTIRHSQTGFRKHYSTLDNI